MSSETTISHTVIVSADEAAGYMMAGGEVPGATVEARVPETKDEAELLVAEHIGTLLRDHGPGIEDGDGVIEFIDQTLTEMEGAFGEPDGGVFVRITVPRDDLAGSRLSFIALRAAELASADS